MNLQQLIDKVTDVLRRLRGERRVYVYRESRGLTDAEQRAIDRAFKKFDEAFREMNDVFK